MPGFQRLCPAAILGLAMACLIGCGSNTTSQSGGKATPSGASGPLDPAGNYAKLTGTIRINGSSSLFPVTEAAAEEFQKATRGQVNVTVNEGGTGSGFREFLRGEIEICDASRPITNDELAKAKEVNLEFIELPVCFDAITIAVHPSNKLSSITTAELKKMWEPAAKGKVTRWKDVNPDWPDEPLALFGAGTSSGTFEYFTQAVTGKAKDSRSDYTGSEDDNLLVQSIAGNKGALGYIPYAYYEPNKDKLKALAVDWDKDDAGPVEPNMQNVEQGKYNPFSRPLFVYVNRAAADRAEVQAFVEFYIQRAREFAEEQKYLPLPEAAYAMVGERFAKRQTGSGFKGEPEFGLRVEQILERKPQ